MSALRTSPQKQPRTRVIDALTDATRRHLLAHLLEQGRATEAALADALVSPAVGTSAEGRSRDAVDAIRTEMRHVHLPELVDAGLVSWNRSEGTVAPVAPALDDSWVTRLLEVADEGWDDVLSAVAHERRELVLEAVAAEDGTLSRDGLAREVAAREADGVPSSEAVEALRGRLHHVHLPALDDAGLVDYDVETGAVSPDDASGRLSRLLDVLPDDRQH